MSQPNPKQSSKRVLTVASHVMRNKNASVEAKELAGSVMAQAPYHEPPSQTEHHALPQSVPSLPEGVTRNPNGVYGANSFEALEAASRLVMNEMVPPPRSR